MNNTIGDTPQPNGWMDDWVEFFRERRIGRVGTLHTTLFCSQNTNYCNNSQHGKM
jgi:fructosamine-3-kinase